MKILIVGLGAIGSHVALALRNIDAELTLCDFDVIEHKNTQAQFHLAKDVRKKKASAMRESLYGFSLHLLASAYFKLTRIFT